MVEARGMLFLYVETPLHAGTGTALGAVDLPIQRERHTQFPIVQGSGIKGALRAVAEEKARSDEEERKKVEVVFGPRPEEASEHAGALVVQDARILLFPVRSVAGVFAWTTCPSVLARFERDARSSRLDVPWQASSVKVDNERVALVAPNSEVTRGKSVVLEDFSFEARDEAVVADIGNWLSQNVLPDLAEYRFWREALPRRLVVLHDNCFRDFCLTATEVVTRIRLKTETKTVEEGGLWTEEALPSESVLYAPIFATPVRARNKASIADAKAVLRYVKGLDIDRIQLGGDETVGRGIVKVRIWTEGGEG
ncbi:MAG TPA: type III-B CRISPR module RAMP protein Cmr4 [Armatimonadetes bacterium]|nr:type III-B CRISPR module RAMP protein Cmr4 [Armatimonadota bacterium]